MRCSVAERESREHDPIAGTERRGVFVDLQRTEYANLHGCIVGRGLWSVNGVDTALIPLDARVEASVAAVRGRPGLAQL